MALSGIHHATVFIMTANRPAALAFYQGVLGLGLVAEDRYGAVMEGAGLLVRLTDIADHQPSPHPVLGFEVADIRHSCADLAALGVTCLIYPGFGQDAQGVWTSDDGKTRLAWFSDPDGNVLGLSQKD